MVQTNQVASMRDRLRRWQAALTNQHNLWLASDPTAITDEKFAGGLAKFDQLERVYRCAVPEGCINEDGCPEASPVMCDACC